MKVEYALNNSILELRCFILIGNVAEASNFVKLTIADLDELGIFDLETDKPLDCDKLLKLEFIKSLVGNFSANRDILSKKPFLLEYLRSPVLNALEKMKELSDPSVFDCFICEFLVVNELGSSQFLNFFANKIVESISFLKQGN